MAVCRWCGDELPEYVWGDRGHNPRLYCSPSHRQLAYIARKKANEQPPTKEHG